MTKCLHCGKEIKLNSSSEKIKYSEFVEMTPEQYKRLIDKYGFKQTANMIFTLDLAIPNQLRKPYKCHYRAILSWVVKEVKAVQICKPENKNNLPEPKFVSKETIHETVMNAKENMKKARIKRIGAAQDMKQIFSGIKLLK